MIVKQPVDPFKFCNKKNSAMQSNCLPSFLLFTQVSLSPSLSLNFPFFLPSFPPSTSIFNFAFHYSMLPATV